MFVIAVTIINGLNIPHTHIHCTSCFADFFLKNGGCDVTEKQFQKLNSVTLQIKYTAHYNTMQLIKDAIIFKQKFLELCGIVIRLL